MTAFIAAAGLLVAVALAFLLPALLRQRRDESVDRGQANLALLREQLADLDAERADGAIGAERYEQSRQELERRVLEENRAGSGNRAAVPRIGRAAAATIALIVPIAATLLYLKIGNLEALDRRAQAVQAGPAPGHADLSREQIEGMIGRLEARLREQPDDGTGWVLLARSRLVLQQFAEAVQAYAKAAELITDNAGLYADYADALGMLHGRRLTGEPERLIARALELDPGHVKALALAGSVAFEKKDYRGAVSYWERILQVVPADSQIAGSIRASIADANSLAGGAPPAMAAAQKPAPAPAAAPSATISGRVSLAPALAGKAAPEDTVFVLARALSGPPMPLAIVRRQVKNLPLEFTLTDAQAMAPQMKISNFSEVAIIARVSKSGGAAAQSGDLQGTVSAVKVGAQGLKVVIDTVVP